MPVPIFHGDVKGGKIRFDRPDQLREFVPSLEGKRIEMVLRPESKRLSHRQRKYLHGVALAIFGEFLGKSPAELKAHLKLKFLWDGETVDAAGFPVVPSTESLDERRYSRFLDDTIRLAAECGCSIPAPGEVE